MQLRWLIFLSILYTISLRAEVLTAKKCKVQFETTGEPVLIKIVGKSETECTGSITIDGGKMTSANSTLNLLNLDTGIKLRNKHLRDNYLETAKFPKAVLKVTKISDFTEQKSGKKKSFSNFEAELELHGEKNFIEGGQYRIDGSSVKAAFSFDLPNWKIKRPSFMGVNIVDKVFLTINFEI